MSDNQLPFFDESEFTAEQPVIPPQDNLEEPEWILALLGLKGIGNKKALGLIQKFKSIQNLRNASSLEIQKVVGKVFVNFEKLERLDASQPDGVKLLTYFDSLYPSGIRDLEDPPPLLWYRGIVPTSKSVAIVGTRNADQWGQNTTRLIARKCGEKGLSVVSGLALGIDTEAHKGCLETSSPTVAILACDVRFPTPNSNSKLAELIIERGGCLIAEVPPGIETKPHGLVARNRLQAAWGRSLIVTQCGIPSGTLHTVRNAIELGRQVVTIKPPEGCIGNQYDGNRRLSDIEDFDLSFLGGSKKFQELFKNRKHGADLVLNSVSEIEMYLENV